VTESAHVAVWHDGGLLLIRNSYKSGETVPSGALKRHESALEAAQRELWEEVGVEASTRDLAFACELIVPYDHKRDTAHFFELQCTAAPAIAVDRREVIWAAFCPEDELATHPLVPHLRAYLERRRLRLGASDHPASGEDEARSQ
jgi:8-oxo-dGTP pyrophosphatase MutT (NUDIX family)